MAAKKSNQKTKNLNHYMNRQLSLPMVIVLLLITVGIVSSFVIVNSRGSLDFRSWAKGNRCLSFNQAIKYFGQKMPVGMGGESAVSSFQKTCYSTGGNPTTFTKTTPNSANRASGIPGGVCYTCYRCNYNGKSSTEMCPYKFDFKIGRPGFEPNNQNPKLIPGQNNNSFNQSGEN